MLFIITINNNFVSSSVQKEVIEIIDVTHDAYVDSGEPEFNFKSDSLNVRYWESFSVNESQIVYLGFSYVFPENVTITSFMLEIEVLFMPVDGHSIPINIWETSSFNEDTITFNNAPVLVQTIGSATINEDKRWSIQLNKDLLGVKNAYYFAIETNLESLWGITFASQDSSFFGDPAKLIITYDDPNITDPPIPDSFFGAIILGAIILGVISLYYFGKRGGKQKTIQKPIMKQTSQQTEGFCRSCGNPKEVGKLFCGNCGEKY